MSEENEERLCDLLDFKDERIAQLEEENDKLRAAVKSLEVLKDPVQPPIPWNKVKLDLRIAQLEEALQTIAKGTMGVDKHGLYIQPHEIARAALSRGPSKEVEGE